MTLLITGGAGFIGANFVNEWLLHRDEPVVILDKLTYAGRAENIASKARDSLVVGDIADGKLVLQLLEKHLPRAILHFAAESHVDRSIAGPAAFVQTNICGTFELLEATRAYLGGRPEAERSTFRFLHVSTDEVYGALKAHDPAFVEETAYAPNSPYAASKAASDHLVRAFHHTFGVPVLTTNCSNNYGPYQYPEKLIPVVIGSALEGAPIPVYGAGLNVRDWLYVADHCSAIRAVLDHGRTGETYNIGGNNEIANIEVVRQICSLLDEMSPAASGRSYQEQISFITDRPGHDFRYAINSRKISAELGWTPSERFDTGLRKTVRWCLDNHDWIKDARSRNPSASTSA